MLKQNDQVITKPLPFGNEKLKVAQKNQEIQNLIQKIMSLKEW